MKYAARVRPMARRDNLHAARNDGQTASATGDADATDCRLFVNRAQELGFTLDEAEQLLRLRRVNTGRWRRRSSPTSSRRCSNWSRCAERCGTCSRPAAATARSSARFWRPWSRTAMSDLASPSLLGTWPAVVAALAAGVRFVTRPCCVCRRCWRSAARGRWPWTRPSPHLVPRSSSSVPYCSQVRCGSACVCRPVR